MPADPVAAGKKGGASKSAKKLAACKRNGFQRVYPRADEPQPEPQKEANETGQPVLVVSQ